MNSPRYAELAAQVITEGVRVDVPPVSSAHRALAIAAVERALVERRRRLRARRLVVLASAGAGLAAAVTLLMVRTPSPPADGRAAAVASRSELATVTYSKGSGGTIEVAGASTPLVGGAPVAKGSRITTRAGGGATLLLATGTKLTLDEQARLSFEGEGERQVFALAAGTVAAQVAKLSANQQFVVRTSDAEVEVRGTTFRVTDGAPLAACEAETTTRVAVDEGVVVVRFRGNEHRVAAGETWPTGCGSEAARAAAPTATGAPKVPTSDRQHAKPAGAMPVEPQESSHLAEQNDLFAQAMAARRAGRSDEAVQRFNRLIAQYPRGPLAENATVERFRTLRELDPAKAAASAREYLERYPSGFARREAEGVIGGR